MGHTPFLAVWGQGPSVLTTVREGGAWRKSESQKRVLGQVTGAAVEETQRGLAQVCIQDAGPLGFSAVSPADGGSRAPQQHRLLSMAFCGSRMEASGSCRLHQRERRPPREVGGASGGKRKQTSEMIARAAGHPPGAEAPPRLGQARNDLGAGCSVTWLTQGWPRPGRPSSCWSVRLPERHPVP